MKIDANGAVGKPGARGDFGAGHALDEAKNERLAVGFGEATERIKDGMGFSVRVSRGTEGGSRLLGFLGRGFLVECFVRLDATMEVGGAVARNGREPTGKLGDFAKGDEPRQSLKKDVLNEVVNVGMRHAGEENAVDHAGIAGVEETEGVAVTVLGGADERVVRAAGFRGWVHGREAGAGGLEFKECGHVGAMEMKNRLYR